MSRPLYRSLVQAHRLNRRERKICRRLVKIYNLTGKGGPATFPAAIFFRPSFWGVFARDAADGRDRLDPDEILALARKLFAAGIQAPPPAPRAERSFALAAATESEALPRDW